MSNCLTPLQSTVLTTLIASAGEWVHVSMVWRSCSRFTVRATHQHIDALEKKGAVESKTVDGKRMVRLTGQA